MLIRLILATVLLVAALAPVGAQTPLKPAELARQFEEVAFPERLDAKGAPGPGRFLRPPRSISLSVAPDHRAPGSVRKLDAILRQVGPTLREMAGVPIEIKPGGRTSFDVDGVRAQDFAVAARRLGDDDPRHPTLLALAQYMKKVGCFAYTYQHDNGSIYGGRIVIDVSRPVEGWTPCVYRGVLHFLGLDGTTRGPTGVFADLSDFRGLTPRDLAMIRMVYDPRLKPGMTLAEARPLLPAIAADALSR